MAAATISQHTDSSRTRPRASREDLAALIATHTTSLADSVAELALIPGRVVALEGAVGAGLTRLALVMLAGIAVRAPVAVVDTRGWFCPVAAWEVGIPPARLSVIRCSDADQWPSVMGALLTGFGGIYAEVPPGVSDQVLRRLGAKARQERAGVALRPMSGCLPSGIAHMRLTAGEVVWAGPDQGHGRLGGRTLSLHASGKGVRGIEQWLGVEDDGTSDVHLVGNLAAVSSGRSIG